MQRFALLFVFSILIATPGAACSGDDASGPTATPTQPPKTASPTQPGATPASGLLASGPVFTGDRETDTPTAIANGDFNADGSVDLALGAAFVGESGHEDAGAVYVFLGPLSTDAEEVGTADADIVLTGIAGEQVGRALAAGDLTGDGIDDLAIGAPAADGGRVYLLAGAEGLGEEPTTTLGDEHVVLSGARSEDLLGLPLVIGDFNGDGAADLAAGAFGADGPVGNREDAGAVYLVLGPREGRLDGAAADAIVHGAEAGDRLGETLGAADFNGDGRTDLVAVATFADGPENSRENAGEAYVFAEVPSGEIDLAQRAPAVTIIGIDPGDQLGHSAASTDFNGDGFDDLVLGAVSADGAGNSQDLAGEVTLVLGSAGPPEIIDARDLPVMRGVEGSRLGRSVAGGDMNGDGYGDALLAAPRALDAAGTDTGAIYLLLGDPTGAFPSHVTEADQTLYGRSPDDRLGSQVAGIPALLAADLDGDGLDDLVVAARHGGGPRGEVRVYYARLD